MTEGFEGRVLPFVLARGLYVDDLVFGRPPGRGDRDLVSDAALEDGAAHGRGMGEFAAPGVGLVGPDDLEGPLLVPAEHPQGHAGAEIHRAGLRPGGVDDLRVPQAALDLADPALQKILLVLGVVVLGILGDVAELPGLPDAVRDLPPAYLRQILKFFLELLETLPG